VYGRVAVFLVELFPSGSVTRPCGCHITSVPVSSAVCCFLLATAAVATTSEQHLQRPVLSDRSSHHDDSDRSVDQGRRRRDGVQVPKQHKAPENLDHNTIKKLIVRRPNDCSMPSAPAKQRNPLKPRSNHENTPASGFATGSAVMCRLRGPGPEFGYARARDAPEGAR
jgi:hypothetical protein